MRVNIWFCINFLWQVLTKRDTTITLQYVVFLTIRKFSLIQYYIKLVGVKIKDDEFKNVVDTPIVH